MQATRLLTRTEAAEYMQVHPHTVWKMTRDGRLPAVKVGRYLRYHLSDIRQALEPVGI